MCRVACSSRRRSLAGSLRGVVWDRMNFRASESAPTNAAAAANELRSYAWRASLPAGPSKGPSTTCHLPPQRVEGPERPKKPYQSPKLWLEPLVSAELLSKHRPSSKARDTRDLCSRPSLGANSSSDGQDLELLSGPRSKPRGESLDPNRLLRSRGPPSGRRVRLSAGRSREFAPASPSGRR